MKPAAVRPAGASTPRTVRTLAPAVLMLAICAATATPAPAQTVSLNLVPTSISFASADPDTTPQVAAQQIVTITYRVRGNRQGSWSISVAASGDLTSGATSIPISTITWTAAPAPTFQGGTMSATTDQPVASGSGNVDPAQDGTVLFFFANSWSHNVGTYSTVFTFTLTAQ